MKLHTYNFNKINYSLFIWFQYTTQTHTVENIMHTVENGDHTVCNHLYYIMLYTVLYSTVASYFTRCSLILGYPK